MDVGGWRRRLGDRVEDHSRIRFGVPVSKSAASTAFSAVAGSLATKTRKGNRLRHPHHRLIERRGVAIVDHYATVEQGCWHSRHKGEDRPEESNLAAGSMLRQFSE